LKVPALAPAPVKPDSFQLETELEDFSQDGDSSQGLGSLTGGCKRDGGSYAPFRVKMADSTGFTLTRRIPSIWTLKFERFPRCSTAFSSGFVPAAMQFGGGEDQAG
jgi:hypothetical protein